MSPGSSAGEDDFWTHELWLLLRRHVYYCQATMRGFNLAIRTLVLGMLLGTAAANIQAVDIDQSSFYSEELSFRLLPEGPLGAHIRSQVEALEPALGIEVRFSLPTKGTATDGETRLAIYNVLRKISTMEGIEYYSASRDEMRVLYHESYVIRGNNNRRRVEDPTVETVPTVETIYAFQRDGSFGRNVQEITYRSIGDGFLMEMKNRTTMVYHLIPLVTPNNLQVYLLVEPGGSGIEVYGHLAVRVPAVFGFQDRARASFYNRIQALANWFEGQLRDAGITLE